MNTEDFLNFMNSGKTVEGGSIVHRQFYEYSKRAIQITMDLNTKYHTEEEIVEIMSKLTTRPVHPSFRLFPPFNTDCGVNIHLGKNVFINSGCKFQDQGGITIGDDVLIGHNVVITTLNHDLNPENRASMVPKAVKIGNKAWIGSNSTILPGVTIGENSVVGAGSVVTKDVPKNTIVAGNPARVIKYIETKELAEVQKEPKGA